MLKQERLVFKRSQRGEEFDFSIWLHRFQFLSNFSFTSRDIVDGVGDHIGWGWEGWSSFPFEAFLFAVVTR